MSQVRSCCRVSWRAGYRTHLRTSQRILYMLEQWKEKMELSTLFHGYYFFPCFQQLGSGGKIHNNENKYSNKSRSDLTNQPTKNLNIPKLAEADREGLCICVHLSYFPIKCSWGTECLCLQFEVHRGIFKFLPALVPHPFKRMIYGRVSLTVSSIIYERLVIW